MRYLRLLAVLALAGVAIFALAPYATNYVSSQAVVNAPLNTVISPIRGIITRPSAAAGTGIAGGAQLVAITLDTPDRRYLEQLRARRALLRETLAALADETGRLDAMQVEMEGRVVAYRERMAARLGAEADETRAQIVAAEAALSNADAVRRRSAILAERGHAPLTRSEADAAARDEAAGEVARLHAQLEQVAIERLALEAGISVQDGWSDVPYSQQRLDEIRLRRAALVAEHHRVVAELSALDEQISAEAVLADRRETFRPEAPGAGVIWKPSGGIGETVVPGEVLVQMVDCTARFVEVALPERHFGDIVPGDPAWVRLKGGGEVVEARVGAVLGAGANFDHPKLAASVYEASPDQLRVLVPLSGTALGGTPAAFCHVGRTAEVRFPRSDASMLHALAANIRAELTTIFGAPAGGARDALVDGTGSLTRAAVASSR